MYSIIHDDDDVTTNITNRRIIVIILSVQTYTIDYIRNVILFN